jgi:2-polyprenyl-3-methyl-5-hydroxy-6-metoxy-1,4-benzoquinol methylase
LKRKDLSIIEVGCGNGNISYQLARNGFKVRGVDISAESISRAKNRYQAEALSYEVVNAEKLANEECYDVVVMSEVLEHLTEPQSVLQAVASMMKPDAIAIITVPNGYGPREMFVTKPVQRIFRSKGIFQRMLFSFKNLLGYKGVTIQSANHDLTHIQFFSYKALNQLAHSCGLSIVTAGRANFLDGVFPFSFITKRSLRMQQFDCWIADQLPLTWASGFNTVMVKSVNK